jgi:hypothetical protein
LPGEHDFVVFERSGPGNDGVWSAYVSSWIKLADSYE